MPAPGSALAPICRSPKVDAVSISLVICLERISSRGDGGAVEGYKVIEVKQSVFADNDRKADALRDRLRQKGQLLVNLMSSPGSGKTTTLARTIEALSPEL